PDDDDAGRIFEVPERRHRQVGADRQDLGRQARSMTDAAHVGVELHLVCAGAAQGVVEALRQACGDEAGARIAATFGAVGAMRERIDVGVPCDVAVLTVAMIASLADEGGVRPDSIAALGRVRTGVAVRRNERMPAIDDAPALRAALVGATAIYVPDTRRSTAGIHVAGMLRTLAIEHVVATRLREFPNGAAAMRSLASDGEPGSIGCPQITAI